jgi:type II secretion system protein G
MFRQNKALIKKGFTLVELLVVVSIIGLLSTIAIVSLNNSRQNARDAKRIADIQRMAVALEMYFDDNGYYPPSPCWFDCNGWAHSYHDSWATLQTALSPYMNKLPVDPINSACAPWGGPTCHSYAYGNVGRDTYPATYDLAVLLETPSHPLSCEKKGWKFAKGCGAHQYWCTAYGGAYSNQIYSFSPN